MKRVVWVPPLLAVLAGCGQAALSPEGDGARAITHLWWLMAVIGTVVYVAVLGLLVVALRRARRSDRGVANGDAPRLAGVPLIVLGGVAVPAVVLATLTVATVAYGRDLLERDAGALRVHVVAHQFWWEITYPDNGAVTANEMHIPAERPVEMTITSDDVIHSFWVPQLHGKIDAIPGRTNTLQLHADEAGSFQGRCAELCGLSHAHMRFTVVADAPDDFDRWLEEQAQPASEPDDDAVAEGREVFLGSACVYCHTVRGTNATSDFGPDLTHLASRSTIAAGTLPNTRGHLGGWILDPQHHKPGNEMPATRLSGPELRALLDYLESLE